MKHWPWRTILTVIASLLVVAGVTPLAYLTWEALIHNYRPLSMPIPFHRGQYTSAVFKTDLDEPYVIQVEFLSPSGRILDLNPGAILDLDWKVVNADGAVLQQGSQNITINGANEVNLGTYQPKRGEAQRMLIDLHQDLAEPEGSQVTLQVNSTEDPEGIAFAYYFALRLAMFMAVPGLILFAALVMFRVRSREKLARTR